MFPFVPVLQFSGAGDPLCPVLVIGDSFDTVREAQDGFDPWVLVLDSNKGKDSTLGIFFWWRKERKRFT